MKPEIGDRVRFWMTGSPVKMEGVVKRMDKYGFPVILPDGWEDRDGAPVLKDGDYILLGKEEVMTRD